MAAVPVAPPAIGNNRYATMTNVETGITATASGSQTAAYPLTAAFSKVAVCATNGDAVILPKITSHAAGDANPGQVGMVMIVRNDSGQTLQVYGGLLDTINAVASATGVSVATAKTAIFIADSYTPSTGVGNWSMVLSA